MSQGRARSSAEAGEVAEPQIGHHPWCNFFGGPAEGCRQCAGLHARYPLGGGTAEQLLAEHFPDVKLVR